MLDGIYDIDWQTLQHAHGPAENLPQLFETVVAEKEGWQEALGRLCDYVLHQGSIYSATPYSVPYLVRLLALPGLSTSELMRLLCTLYYVGVSTSDYGPNNNYWRDFYEKNGQDYDVVVQEMANGVESAHALVVQHLTSLVATSNLSEFVKVIAAFIVAETAESTVSSSIIEELTHALHDLDLLTQAQSNFLCEELTIGRIADTLARLPA